MASSLAFDRDFDLSNQYREILAKGSFAAGKRFAGKEIEAHLVEKVNGPQFSHPLGLPVVAAPFLWISKTVLRVPWPDPVLGLLTILTCFIGLVLGADLLGKFLGNSREGLIVAVLVFSSSPLWFYSRTFFTEPFVWSAVVAGVWLISRRWVLAGGACLGLAIAVREPSLVMVAPVMFGVLILQGWRASLRAAIGPVLALSLVVARNVFLNGGGLLDFPQRFQYGDVVAGSMGLLVDRAHGLLLFMPLTLLAPIGWFLGSDRFERTVLGCSAAGFTLYFLLAASWVDWRGGSCFGPRLVVPAIPLLVPAIALAWRRIARGAPGKILFAAAAVGIGVEVSALANPFYAFWSVDVIDLASRSTSAIAVFTAGVVLAFICLWRLGVPRNERVIDGSDAGRHDAVTQSSAR